jgi:hypothetical protein
VADEVCAVVAMTCERPSDNTIVGGRDDRHVPSASWLDQIEIWFSIHVCKLLRHGNFSFKKDLRTKIEKFIAYFNATVAKPIRWRKPLTRLGEQTNPIIRSDLVVR